MINKRLIRSVGQSKKYIACSVLLQWLSLVVNIVIMGCFALILGELISAGSAAVAVSSGNEAAGISSGISAGGGASALMPSAFMPYFYVILGAAAIRIVLILATNRMNFLSSKAVKRTLRDLMYRKLLRIGAAYNRHVQTSEVVQLSVEGVEQLETYFAGYLPQFFYAMLAPITLFSVLAPFNFRAAVVLFVCVPLIPASIAAVQTWAKKLLSKYWGKYTALGDTFLENLQGLTTLKIYKSDALQHERMNEAAEHFRVITMKVLTMQLNSISIMDLVAYGGAALGIILSVARLREGAITVPVAIFTVLISADFFLPMRALGSFFHIAMNGMAATGKIFRLLDTEEDHGRTACFAPYAPIILRDVSFSYNGDKDVLHHVDADIPNGALISLVGESGCGKTTVASLLTLKNKGYSGSIRIGDKELSDITEESLMANITYISFNSYLFKGTVRENLLMAKPNASDEEIWEALRRANLSDFLRSEDGLDTMLQEKAANLSGGQCQRLALARALLHDTPVYIFDEATSNIDVESEESIMKEVLALKGKKTVVLISHRLANVVQSDRIYVMSDGIIEESGTHEDLLRRGGKYSKLWNAQQDLERYGAHEESHAHGQSHADANTRKGRKEESR